MWSRSFVGWVVENVGEKSQNFDYHNAQLLSRFYFADRQALETPMETSEFK
jgi:hypothetical protein